MKRQIRFNVFETNSSMSHSLQIMSKADFDKLMEFEDNNNWIWCECEEKWICADSDDVETCCRCSYFDEEADYEIKTFITEHGDEVVAISRAKEDY